MAGAGQRPGSRRISAAAARTARLVLLEWSDVGTDRAGRFASASRWTFRSASSWSSVGREVLEREQAARAAAERHSRTKDDFIAVLSHELRTPLNAIVGWVHVLKPGGGTPDCWRRAWTRSTATSRPRRGIISDILDVSRINSGKLRLRSANGPSPARWSPQLDRSAARSRSTAKHLHVESEREEAAQPAWLDPARFQQIFWNLMTNAIKFSPRGRAHRMALAREADRLTLWCGLRPRHRRRIPGPPVRPLHAERLAGQPVARRPGAGPVDRQAPGGAAWRRRQRRERRRRRGATLRVELSGAAPTGSPPRSLTEHQEPRPAPFTERVLDGLDVLVVEDDERRQRDDDRRAGRRAARMSAWRPTSRKRCG